MAWERSAGLPWPLHAPACVLFCFVSPQRALSCNFTITCPLRSRFDSEKTTYRIAAIAASIGVTSLAIVAVHARFAYGRPDGADVPASEALATMLLAGGGAVGMEMYVRWAHRVLWHDLPAG